MHSPLKDAAERGATNAGDPGRLWVVASRSLLLQLELRPSQDQTEQGASDGSRAWTLTAISGASGVPCEVEGIVGARTALMMSCQGLGPSRLCWSLKIPALPSRGRAQSEVLGKKALVPFPCAPSLSFPLKTSHL